jgi:PAS domain-containing protein
MVVAYDVELILMRELASCLATPVFLVDTVGTLIFYNEKAEELLGRRFDETGEMPAHEWATIFAPTDDNGDLIDEANLPLTVALREQRPAYSTMHIDALDGVRRSLQVTALPINSRTGQMLGAAALFWQPT